MWILKNWVWKKVKKGGMPPGPRDGFSMRHDYDRYKESHHRHRSRSTSPDRSRETSRSRSKSKRISGFDMGPPTGAPFPGALDAMRQGNSGGQKKRVTTGEMLVGPASVYG
ncbi:hypothetical protein Tco_1061419 [Tanacetum coccineum]